MKLHHKLKVWKKSRSFVKHIYELTSKLFDAEKFGLTSQMRRAAILIPINIAEAAGRNNHQEFIHFLRISQCSIAERETQIPIDQDLGHFKNTAIQAPLDELDDISQDGCRISKIVRQKMTPPMHLNYITCHSSLVTNFLRRRFFEN